MNLHYPILHDKTYTNNNTQTYTMRVPFTTFYGAARAGLALHGRT